MAETPDENKFAVADASLAASPSAYLAPIVDIPRQEKNDWCWAAVLEGISIRDGRRQSQSELVSRVFRTRSARGRGDDLCGIAFAVGKLTGSEPPDLYPQTFPQVCEILRQRKIIACGVRFESNIFHWLALTGFDSDQRIYVSDPWPSALFQYLMPFDDVLHQYDKGPSEGSLGQIIEMYAL